jgi:pimeloyl-ACP methyl ester carboxylesterase
MARTLAPTGMLLLLPGTNAWVSDITQADNTLLLFQPNDFLFNKLGTMEQQHWCDHLVPFTAKVEDIVISTPDPVWEHIPVTYLICDEDLLIPGILQRSAINVGRQRGALVHEELLKGCGHTPNLSAPDSILVVLQAAADKSASVGN